MHKLLKIIWPGQDFDYGENTVHCPFHNDTISSAHLRVDTNGSFVFHCKVCDMGHNHITLASEFLKTDLANAAKFISVLQKGKLVHEWAPQIKQLEKTPKSKELLTQFGISEDVLTAVKAGFIGTGITFPITWNGYIIDTRTYNPNTKPKVKSAIGATTGTVFPEQAFDKNLIILVEGEKDALVLRSLGLNAATVIGGAQSKPNKTPYLFHNKRVYILYDNDPAGKQGGHGVAKYLLNNPKVNVAVNMVDITLLTTLEKGDVTDAITKEGKTKEDVLEALKQSKEVTLENIDTFGLTDTPKQLIIPFEKADKYMGKDIASVVQTSAVFDSSFSFPKSAVVSGYDDDEVFTTYNWVFSDKWYDALPLFLGRSGDNALKKFYPDLKKNVTVTVSQDRHLVTKALLSSTTHDQEVAATEHLAYVIDGKLESGKEYLIEHTPIVDSQKGNKTLIIVTSTKDISKEKSELPITDAVKASLDRFTTKTFAELRQQAKGIINANFNDKLISVFDLTFHSVLEFNFGRYKNIKGTVDSIVVTDTGFGKSVTTRAFLKCYAQGARASLTGSAATAQGLIGGSKAIGTTGGYQTTAGLIPRNHKKIVIFEELAKNKADIMKELTDIRTSGVAEITRVAGKLTLPANIRMAFASNPKANKDGTNKTIDAYPNGIEIIQDLLGAREDIGRFDLIATLGQRESVLEDPTWEPVDTFEDKDYQTRLKWVWSRKPDQIKYDPDVEQYIAGPMSQYLNDKFESDVQIFGRKTWMKLAKVAIAIAGYMVSHTQDYNCILVKKKHVDLAVQIFEELYDNQTFRLVEHVKEERAYTKVDPGSTDVLRRVYTNQNQIVAQLALVSEIQTNELLTVSALERQDFNQIISDLTLYKLIRNIKGKIVPTEKFRKTYDKISAEPIGTEPETVSMQKMKGGQ